MATQAVQTPVASQALQLASTPATQQLPWQPLCAHSEAAEQAEPSMILVMQVVPER